MLDGSFLIRTGVSVCGKLDITNCDFKFETHYPNLLPGVHMADKRVKEKAVIAVAEYSSDQIRNLIYIIRGVQVMLDSDLAMLYQVETRTLNQAVKRNIARFPERYRFQLTEEEYANLKSQNVISSSENNYGGRRKLPYAFSEQGIAMLSSVLHSDTAVQVSLRIMDTFVEMRRFIANNQLLFEKISSVELKQLEYQKETDEKFDKVFSLIESHKESEQTIFFEGQIYDAFSLLISLIQEAQKDIILVDSYVDVGTLNLLAKKNPGVDVKIITYPGTRLTTGDVSKFNSQYPNLIVDSSSKSFHDRFLILDGKMVYHIGASLKDAGKKCFGISLWKDQESIKNLLSRVK